MIALIVGMFGAGALIAWHMQRRPLPPLALSFARLLPDPRISMQKERRFALILPVASVGFWLRMLALAASLAALVAIWLDLRGVAPPGVALRLVIDTSDSMSVLDKGRPRIDLAREVAAGALVQVRDSADLTCAELITVAATPGAPVRLTGDLPQTPVRAEGASVAGLLTAIAMPTEVCAPTHVLVLTDHPAPPGLIDRTMDGALVIWAQVGAPVANAGLQAMTLNQPGLSGAESRLTMDLTLHGLTTAPAVRVEGPGFAEEVIPVASSSREGLWRAEVPYMGPGTYTASVTDPDGYASDDQLRAEVPAGTVGAVEWRLSDLAAPAPLATGADDTLLVARLDTVSPADLDRPVLLTYSGWPAGATGARIGGFLPDRPLLGALNLDVLEAALPDPLRTPLPAGFSPVMVTDPGNLPILARRVSPPGLIVPHPQPGAVAPVDALSTIIFLSALSDLLDGGTITPPQAWRGPSGPVSLAGLESDTSRTLGPQPEISFDTAPDKRPIGGDLFPILVLLALLCMLVERLHTIWPRGRTQTNAV